MKKIRLWNLILFATTRATPPTTWSRATTIIDKLHSARITCTKPSPWISTKANAESRLLVSALRKLLILLIYLLGWPRKLAPCACPIYALQVLTQRRAQDNTCGGVQAKGAVSPIHVARLTPTQPCLATSNSFQLSPRHASRSRHVERLCTLDCPQRKSLFRHW